MTVQITNHSLVWQYQSQRPGFQQRPREIFHLSTALENGLSGEKEIKALMCTVCPSSWQISHHSQFRAPSVKSLNVELGGGAYSCSPAHHTLSHKRGHGSLSQESCPHLGPSYLSAPHPSGLSFRVTLRAALTFPAGVTSWPALPLEWGSSPSQPLCLILAVHGIL